MKKQDDINEETLSPESPNKAGFEDQDSGFKDQDSGFEVPVLPKRRPIVPKETWDAIEEGWSRCVSAVELGRKYGVDPLHIERHAISYKWPHPSPKKLVKYAKKVIKQVEEVAVSENISPAAAIARVGAPPDWASLGQRYREMIFGHVNGALESLNLEPPKTWRDFEIADRMARKAVGLESGEGTTVQTIIPIGDNFGVERDVTPAK